MSEPELPRTTLVLFVCTANICRSAFAEVLAGKLFAQSGLAFASAGIHGWPAHGVSDTMAEQLRVRGADPSGFRSRPITREIIGEADLILTAEMWHRRWILEEVPIAVSKTFAWGQFERAISSADLNGLDFDGLRRAVRAAAPTAIEGDEIADPYGQGEAAAEVAATRIEELLVRTIGVLLSVKSQSMDFDIT